MLYNVMKMPPPTTTDSGKGSTNEESLLQLTTDVPELETLLQIRKLQKGRTTYLQAFLREQVDGFIHPSINLHIPWTYRSSMDRPNLQNVSKRDKEMKKIVRSVLFPRFGHQLGEFDFSGIEVAIGACYHKDPTMLKYIKDKTTDMHRDMAIQCYLLDYFDKDIPVHKNVLRQGGKNGFVFPQFYGDYYGNCARNLAKWVKMHLTGKWKKGQGIELSEGYHISDHLISKGIKSFDDFEQHIKEVEADFWGRRFKVYAEWKEETWEEYQRKGYIDFYTGFRCSGVFDKRQILNAPIQGTAFHCLLWSFVRTDETMLKEEWETRLINQVHDSMMPDIQPKELEHVAKTIHRIGTVELPKAWDWIIVPLEIEADVGAVDASWYDLEPYQFTKAA
jgi:DNA polymerase I-like protein with 3'-5' exonuclease and polymerase domains